MMKLVILGAHGRIARLVTDRILAEPAFRNVTLTLFLRNAHRLAQLEQNPRVTVVDGDITDQAALTTALQGADLVFLATVDSRPGNAVTHTVIAAMHAAGVSRLIASSSIGINHEGPNQAFIDWNQQMIGPSLAGMHAADQLLRASDLDYTTTRFAWLNDRDNRDYVVNRESEPFAGGSGSRQSMADVILKIVADPTLYVRETIGISDPATRDAGSMVY